MKSADQVADSPRGLERLFSPVRVGALNLRNRIVMAPMTRSFAPHGVHGPNAALYYRRRAENGVGLIITEGSWIPHRGAANEENIPAFYGEAALASWAEILREVHAVGGKIMPQLWHAGLMINPKIEGIYADAGKLYANQCGPSGLAGGVGAPIERLAEPMTQRDIVEVIDAFATAAGCGRRYV